MNAEESAAIGSRPTGGDAIFGRVLVGIDGTPESLVAAAQGGVVRLGTVISSCWRSPNGISRRRLGSRRPLPPMISSLAQPPSSPKRRSWSMPTRLG